MLPPDSSPSLNDSPVEQSFSQKSHTRHNTFGGSTSGQNFSQSNIRTGPSPTDCVCQSENLSMQFKTLGNPVEETNEITEPWLWYSVCYEKMLNAYMNICSTYDLLPIIGIIRGLVPIPSTHISVYHGNLLPLYICCMLVYQMLENTNCIGRANADITRNIRRILLVAVTYNHGAVLR